MDNEYRAMFEVSGGFHVRPSDPERFIFGIGAWERGEGRGVCRIGIGDLGNIEVESRSGGETAAVELVRGIFARSLFDLSCWPPDPFAGYTPEGGAR